ncbi:MAG: glycosyltransferase [Thermoguttaceae bacterium]
MPSKTANPVKTESAANASRPLRVMHVFGGRVRSGVETSILTLAGGQREDGDEVILTPLGNGSFTTEARDLGFTVEPLDKRRRYDLLSIPRLARLIRRRRIDIVHSHAINGAFYACPAGRLAGVRAQVSHFRGDTAATLEDVYRNELPRRMALKYHLWLTRWCRRLITVNPVLRDDLIRDGIPPDKIVFIPNATDADACLGAKEDVDVVRAELELPPEARVVVAIGRLAPVKNLPMLLEAVKRLIEHDRNLRLVLVGDGPDQQMLQEMARRLGISGNVRFTGWRDDTARIIAAADLYALTSTTEGMPNSVMEAMALAVPVVATDVGGMKELVHHEQTGLLVASGDADQLAESIRSLLSDKDRARRLGEAGRTLVRQEFTASALVQRVRQVYLEALGRSQPHQGKTSE